MSEITLSPWEANTVGGDYRVNGKAWEGDVCMVVRGDECGMRMAWEITADIDWRERIVTW